MGDNWTVHKGSHAPRHADELVRQDDEVTVILRDGTENSGRVDDFIWAWDSDGDSDIVFWRFA
jgi:hypothetical protein